MCLCRSWQKGLEISLFWDLGMISAKEMEGIQPGVNHLGKIRGYKDKTVIKHKNTLQHLSFLLSASFSHWDFCK